MGKKNKFKAEQQQPSTAAPSQPQSQQQVAGTSQPQQQQRAQGGGGQQQQQGAKPQQQKGPQPQQQQGGRPQQQQKGPQQQPTVQPQQQGAKPQQQQAWGSQQQQPGGRPQQQQAGGQPQQQGGRPQQPGGQAQQQGGRPQQQGSRPQQPGGQPQQQGSRPQQPGGQPQQQPQQQQAWGSQQQGGRPQQTQAWGSQQQQPGGRPQQGQRPQESDTRSQTSRGSGDGGNQRRDGGGGGGYQQRGGGDGGYQSRDGGGGGGYQQRGGGDGGYQRRDGGGGGGYQQRGGGDGGYQRRDDGGGGGYQQRSGGYQQRGGGGGDARRGDGGGGYRPPQTSGGPLKILETNSPGIIPRGKLGRQGVVETNYLQLNLDKMPNTAYHYDVSIEPDRPKKLIRPAFELFNKQVFPKVVLAFDGNKNAYSVVKLAGDALGKAVEITVEPGPREKIFKIVLKETRDVEIDLNSLRNYYKERVFDKPMRALQCLEVVMSNPCHSKGVRVGRSFYTRPDRTHDLDDGYELWFGLYQAAILGDQPFLNVDISHKSFPKECLVTEFLAENRVDINRELQYRDIEMLTKYLNRINIIYEAPEGFNAPPKLFKVNSVKESALKLKFTNEKEERISVADYFASKGYRLRYPHLCCLHVGSTVKTNYIPLELCRIAAGQATMGRDGPRQVQKMIRFAATTTDERKDKIMRMLHSFQHNVDTTVRQFGIQIGLNFIAVPMRILNSPKVEYCRNELIMPRNGSWRMGDRTNFILTPKIASAPQGFTWCIIYPQRDRDVNIHNVNELGELILKVSRKLGMNLEPKFAKLDYTNVDSKLLELKKQNYNLVIVILPFMGTTYAKVKQAAELKHGILTQCIKSSTVKNRSNVETVQNIMLKVNAKLNGANHKIAKDNEISLQKSNVMFLGADVTHPSPDQKDIPSVVGVAASHDLFGTRYNMQYRLQAPANENIVDMEEIFTHHMMVYKNNNNTFPSHIIYYRDGVSDGQFPIVKRIELTAIRSACAKLKCKPKLTCLIVVKRHHTRFFPQPGTGSGKFNNVDPGTVVDRIIVHPNEVQFFMVSHQSIQGTAKPTRYNVIEDDSKIDIDELQALTYNLCHLFPRCNRVVSYPAPAYLAHLVAFRGRVYIEGDRIDVENLKRENTRRVVHRDVMVGNPMYFV